MAPVTIHRVVVVTLFLPQTVSFQVANDKLSKPVDLNLIVPKPNLIEGLAAKHLNLPPTPTPREEDPIDKLFSPKPDQLNPLAQKPPRPPLTQPRSRAQRQDSGSKNQQDQRDFSVLKPRRRRSLSNSRIFAEAPWTFEPGPQGNIGLQNAIKTIENNLVKRIWVGTLGMPTDALTVRTREEIKQKLLQEHDSVLVLVEDHEFEGHYNQFCKQVLWPTFHYVLPDNPKSKGLDEQDNSWKHYVALNQKFADSIVEIYEHGDIIWVNDYHLLLVPAMVRKRLPNAMIGFFLHIPFPSSEVFKCLPVRKEILEGVLDSDLIGFQTESFSRHFRNTCSHLLSLETTPRGIQLENNFVSIGLFPIGIDVESLNEKRKNSEVIEWCKVLKEKYHGKKLVVARDKLDYVKGVRQKMLAFERFLTIHTEWQEKAVLIQVATSTTEQNELQSQVSDVVSRINSKFSNLAYQPVVYLHKDITYSQYLALLTAADACLITSLRDGMNLTSHEYIFAGTFDYFSKAIRINPWDYRECAEAIHEALTISESNADAKWKALYSHVTTNNSQHWAESFITELEKVHSDMQRRYSIHIPHLVPRSFSNEFATAKKRLFLLDYDGTIAAYERSPPQVSPSTPSAKLIEVLTKLTSNPRNYVYIMSGRTVKRLEEDLGSIPNLENGAFLKLIGDRRKWEELFSDIDMSWKEQVNEIFEYYHERTPGTLIEQKEVSLVWHYRNVDNLSYGSWQAAECQNHIQVSLGLIYMIHAIAGNKTIEVMPKDVNKGVAIARILENLTPDFILCIGDDRTDEDMFDYLNRLTNIKTVITCTVGSKSTEANFFIGGVSSVLSCLEMLTTEEFNII
nr:5658_t:CDS:10 [Entrophospora candida]